jgi:hypothetical protein
MNSVSIIGYVTRKWNYGTDHFIRLAVPRGPALPPKAEDEDRDGNIIRRNNDYVTVRLPANLFGGVPVAFSKGQQVEVVGYIQSRDYHMSLAHFLERANGPRPELNDGYDPRSLTERRNATEVVALTISPADCNGNSSKVYVVDEEPEVT